ncbi:Gamma-glutamyltranspeptidase [Mycena kentingensis (nom. inval.)]|nr:Gamma-glutamyltranspeptidase [Mycena kentingensis (nom. inval.)]
MTLSVATLLLGLSLLSPAQGNNDAWGSKGAVVSEVSGCSDHGVEILKIGGSAADAIIATGLCVGTIGAYHSGIGGGGFMLVRSQPQNTKHRPEYETIDFREFMPALGNVTMYSNNSNPTASTRGGLSVGVPGELRGWEMLHKRHGKLPWAVLFQSAIHEARYGFKVNVDLAAALNATTYPFLLTDPLWAEVYAPNGTIAQLGDTIYRKRYAATLEKIALHGVDAFYRGSIAEKTSKAALETGGILTTADLARYAAIVRTPNNITYRNRFRIFSTVAPSSGTVVLSALKIFDAYARDVETNETTHALIQATKFGYGQRTTYGDPAFTKNVSALEEYYLRDETVAAVRARLPLNTTFAAPYYNPSGYAVLDDHGTSHMAAVDRWGNAVSLTTTINLFWGSRVMTADGVILNNEMDDFSSPGAVNSFGFEASPINFIAPFKRPQSSIASSIAEDLESGEFVMATGSAGGSLIITATLQNLHHHLDLGMSANASVFTPRWHDQLGTATMFEGLGAENKAVDEALGITPFANSTIAYLGGLGYNVSGMGVGSTSHVIVKHKEKGLFEAANDPRKPAGGGSAY